MSRIPEDADGITILLVEDEALIALDERRVLESSGYAVVVAHSGTDAVAVVQDRPDVRLVLMDIDLGAGIDGTEAARRILELRAVPIVFLTGHAEHSYVECVERITRYGYVLKGTGEFVLLQAVKSALELFSAHERARRHTRRLELIAENTNELIVSFDEDLRIRYAGPSVATLLGYRPDGLANMSVTDLLTADAAQQFRDVIAELPAGDHAVSREFEHRRRDGSMVLMETVCKRFQNGGGKQDGYILSSRDITERRKAEQALERRQEEYRLLVDNQRDLVVKTDRDGLFEFVSDSYCALFGKHRDELIGRSFVPLVHEEDREATRLAMEDLFRPPYQCRIEQRAFTKSGWRWLEWEDSAVLGAGGRVEAIIGSGRDITERKEAEAELQRSETRLQTILETLPVPVVISEGASERVLSVNQAFLSVFGYDMTDMPTVGAWWPMAYPDEQYRHYVETEWRGQIARARTAAGVIGPMQVSIQTKHGDRRFVEVRGHVVGELHMITFTDLTEINAAQRELEEAIREKDYLLKELNHRVKNNLALVSSLISLKEEELGAPADLQDIRNHISAMEFLHEQLYQTNRVTSIDFRTYAQALLPRLFSFYSGGHVKIEGAMESLLMPTKTAVSIGVILNELATNAMKHGFLESEDAVFRVSLTTEDSAAAEDAGPDATAPPEPDTIDPPRLSADTVRPATEEPRYCVLKVGNSGRSFPAEVSLENPGTLGLRLISALVSQLKGSLDITRRPSATFTLRFPL